MIPTRRRALAICASAVLAGCAGEGSVTHRRFRAFGAEARITLAGDPVRAGRAVAACRAEVARLEAAFSLYDPRSALSRLNRDGRIDAPDAAFRALAAHAREMAERTRGSFDPTVQALWLAAARRAPLAEARARVDWRGLRIEADAIRLLRPGMAVSFNGIAQGYAADRVAALLLRLGYRDLLVDLGEFRALGTRNGLPWRLGIGDPRSGGIAARLDLENGAIATSEPRGTLIHGAPHIFDPLARPGERWLSVTVQAARGWRADALSTAVAAAPVEAAATLLQAGGARRAWLLSPKGRLHRWPAQKAGPPERA